MTVTTTDHILLRRTVRLTARASGLLFAGALATRAARPGRDKTAQQLYIAFAATHLVHFAVVARYAMATGGRNLFPGWRHLDDVGGWPTVLTIYALFGGLVVTGREAVGSAGPGGRTATMGYAASGLIGTMFVGTYLGQLRRSYWFAVPATVVGAAVTARLVTAYRGGAP